MTALRLMIASGQADAGRRGELRTQVVDGGTAQ
jgi:hypothetical protein